MAFITHVILENVSPEQYDAVRAECGWLDEAPNGGRAHLAYWIGSDNHNIDVWDSPEDFQAFGETRLGPAMAKVGVNAEPKVEFFPAHEVFLPEARTLTATPR
jgi:hypothetical protein